MLLRNLLLRRSAAALRCHSGRRSASSSSSASSPPRSHRHHRGGGGGGGAAIGGFSSPSPPLGSSSASEWWAVDGEMDEVGEGVPHRERFAIPRDNLPNRRRKQMRDQFMRRTRLVLKDSEQESWCKRYMELYQEMRENWERLYWDEGYSKKIAQDHVDYESAEDDDFDFSPYRRSQSHTKLNKEQAFGGNKQDDRWERVNQIRDKFEYDRERRMREKAFAPMNMANNFDSRDPSPRNQPFDAEKFFPQSYRD
uniref:Uncharacterized protein n=1 Tax=Ananas comosus var. bracteatus TaxID=296719 RepID=A0A6V7Q0R1_ANACO|nr:unnamed protein product [Ananas comosus var. bracteatus]